LAGWVLLKIACLLMRWSFGLIVCRAKTLRRV